MVTGISLKTVEGYLQQCSWFEAGNLTSDLLGVLNFLASTPDSRWVVSETKRAVVLVCYWYERVKHAARLIENDIAVLRDSLDRGVRERLVADRRVVRMRSVEAGMLADPELRSKMDAQQQYEVLLGVIDGIRSALDTSLVVQESAAARRQEQVDNLTP